MNEKEWRQLVNNALNNDEAAFERLYKETERSVYFLCLKLLGNEQDAKDAAQETYLAAFNGLSSLDDGANFPMWINGIAVNQCKRFFRTPQNESFDEKLEHGVDFSDDENFIPDDYVTDAEKRKVIMNMIDKELSEVQRQTIILYYYNGLKTNEIASIMSCPEGTVKYRLSAARDKIKEAVLIYEKENKDRLHAIVPIPILTLILRSEAEHTVVPNVRLFKNPAASAKHLKTGGKAIMKKALTGKVIAAAAAVVVVGGGITAAIALNNNNDSNISKQDSGSSNVILDNSGSSDTDNSSESTTDTQTEPETEPETIPKKEPVILDWAGFSITLPSEFIENWDINDSANYYRIKYRDTEDAIHVQYSAFSSWGKYNPFFSSREEPEHRPEEVRDIVYNDLYFLDTFNDKTYGPLDAFFHYSDPKRTVFSVDEEESLELDGCPFLKQSGILTLEKEYGGSYDVSYVAYYGVIPDKWNGDRPFVLFFHTQSTKPEVIAEMKETAKTVAENGVYVGDDT